MDASFRVIVRTEGYKMMKPVCEMGFVAFVVKISPLPVSLARLRLVVLVAMQLEQSSPETTRPQRG
jgi:hypothetical protein